MSFQLVQSGHDYMHLCPPSPCVVVQNVEFDFRFSKRKRHQRKLSAYPAVISPSLNEVKKKYQELIQGDSVVNANTFDHVSCGPPVYEKNRTETFSLPNTSSTHISHRNDRCKGVRQVVVDSFPARIVDTDFEWPYLAGHSHERQILHLLLTKEYMVNMENTKSCRVGSKKGRDLSEETLNDPRVRRLFERPLDDTFYLRKSPPAEPKYETMSPHNQLNRPSRSSVFCLRSHNTVPLANSNVNACIPDNVPLIQTDGVVKVDLDKIIQGGIEKAEKTASTTLLCAPDRIRLIARKFTELDLDKNPFGAIMQWKPIHTDCLFRIGDEMVKTNPKIFVEKKLEKEIWASFYTIVASLRLGLSSDKENTQAYLSKLKLLLPMGNRFFEKLLLQLSFHWKVSLDNVRCRYGLLDFPEGMPSDTKIEVATTFYSIFLHLGDISRYYYGCGKLDSTHWRNAMSYYESARLCLPHDGRPYFLMGVLASIKEDILGAVFSFSGSHKLEKQGGARGKLLVIYDDMYKSYEKVQRIFWYQQGHKVEKFQTQGYIKQEIWIFPELNNIRPPSFPPEPHTVIEHVDKIDTVELFRRFLLDYLLVCGKLFTKIGLDDFEKVAEEACVYFQAYINNGGKLNFTKAMQITGVLLNIMDNLKVKGEDDGSSEYIQTLGVGFLLELFSLMVERLKVLIVSKAWDSNQFESLAACVQIICTWLAHNQNVWVKPRIRPVFSVRRLMVREELNTADLQDDVWVIFAQLMTELDVIIKLFASTLFPPMENKKSEVYSFSVLPLPESLYLHKYLDCIAPEPYELFCTEQFAHSNQKKARNFYRLKAIHLFGECILCSPSVKYLKTESAKYYGATMYTSVVKLLRPKSAKEKVGLTEEDCHYYSELTRLEKPTLHNIQNSRPPRPDCNNGRVILKPSHEEKLDSAERILTPDNHAYKTWLKMSDHGYRTDCVVRPKRVVLDTNCYIDFLEDVKVLIRLLPYPIWIPVTVASELRGLLRGGFSRRDHSRFKGEKSTTKAIQRRMDNEITAQYAKDAMDFISSNMDHFRVVSMSGTPMNVKHMYDKRIREDFNPNDVNDDRILNTCLYAEATDLKYRKMDTAHRIYRNTVLLTNDRCLRIKTASSNLPVREIRSFTFWVALSVNHVPRKSVASTTRGKYNNGIKKKGKFPLGRWNYVSKAIL